MKVSLKTTMHCNACIAKVKPALEKAGIRNPRFDLASKTVEFDGTNAQSDLAVSILNGLGYQASLEDLTPSLVQTYRPLILVALFLVGITALVEIRAGAFEVPRAMNVFMGGFFIFFSFFKFLDFSGFVDAFSTYDLIARHFRLYGIFYPFMELGLGVAYILDAFSFEVNLATAILMIVGNLGVLNVLRKKQTIQCACLGTVFKLPMTKVTLFENTLMLAMSVGILAFN